MSAVDERNRDLAEQRLQEVEVALSGALSQVSELTAQVNFLTQADEATQAALVGLKKGGVREAAVRPSNTQLWLCRKCGSRAGVYDPTDDELAVRAKELVVRLQLGLGGWVETTCRSCAFPVRLDYELPASLSTEERAEVERATEILAGHAARAQAAGR